MNRIYRKSRRNGLIGRISERIGVRRKRGRRGGNGSVSGNRLQVEALEPRMLLTTISLPADSWVSGLLPATTTFTYVDPEDYAPGDVPIPANIDILTIGTLSGLPPEKDITIEILDYLGRDIPGTLSVANGPTQNIGGGPGGFFIIQEVPPNTMSSLGFSVNALATTPDGDTYGITDTGILLEIDAVLGTVDEIIGQIADTDELATPFDIQFTDFDSAAFDPITGELYAVAVGPTSFDAVGNVITTGEVLIRIDLSDDDEDGINELSDSDGIVEAEAAGRNLLDVPDYTYSVVELSPLIPGDPPPVMDILTITYMETAVRPSLTEPIFLAFNDEGYQFPKEFLTISLVESTITDEVQVVTTFLTDSPDGELAQGLMYDNQLRLWALWNGEVDPLDPDPLAFPPTDGELKEVFLGAPVANRFSDDGIEYPEYVPVPDPDFKSYLTGMSFNRLSNVGYATDPITGTLYQINISSVELVDDDYVNLQYADIYQLYIASSTADTYISIVHNDGANAGQTALLFTDEDGSDIFTPDTAGGVMIGTVPADMDVPPDGIFDTWTPGLAIRADNSVAAIGTFIDTTQVAPDPGAKGVYPGGAFRPGIVLAGDESGAPQNIGKILIAGGVFGDVEISGSLDTFYAGYLGTNRFRVDGDINNVVVGTQSGGIEESDGSWTPVGSAKYGGDGLSPVVEVQGVLNNVYGNDDWGMPILVHGRSDVPHFPGIRDFTSEQYFDIQRELEKFSFGIPGGGLSGLVNNNTPTTAQFLASRDGTVSLVGIIEGPIPDPVVDYYSFAVLAGQPVELQLYDTFGLNFFSSAGDPLLPDSEVVLGFGLSLYDPDMVLVATLGETDIVTGAPLDLKYTPDKAGIYTVEIAPWPTIFDYRLEIEGLAPTTFGGMNIVTDTRGTYPSDVYVDARPLIQVLNGNMGGMTVGEIMRGGQVRVDSGDLQGIRAGFAGNTTTGFNWEIDDDGLSFPLPSPSVSASGYIGSVDSPLVSSVVNVSAGGDIQSVRIGNNYSGTIVSDRNIGTIAVTGSVDVLGEAWDGVFWGVSQTGIFANADGMGDPGIIDRIFVGGDLNPGIPVSMGGSGGNVRFVDVRGTIWYGGSISSAGPAEIVFDPSQAVDIVDDSGVIVHVAPGFRELEVDPVTLPIDPNNPPVTPLGGELTIKFLPITDLTYAEWVGGMFPGPVGYALAAIDSTDGLRVTTDGGPVDIGVLTVVGAEDNQVVFQGNDSIHVYELNVSGVIDQIKNNTPGGDMLAIVIAAGTGNPDVAPPDPNQTDVFPLPEQPIDLIRVDGHLGMTYSTTGQRVETIEFVPADTPITNPIGSQTTGLYSEVEINRIIVSGSLGDTYIVTSDPATTGVNQIILNSDNSKGVGQFDGVAGAIVIDGNLQRIELGDGILDPGTGTYAESGVFITGTLNLAEITGPGHDINGPLYAAVEMNRVSVTDGARVVGFAPLVSTIAVTIGFDDYSAGGQFASGPLNSLEVKGDGSEIFGATIRANHINSIKVSNDAEGIFYANIRVFPFSGLTDSGIIESIIVGGAGIHNSNIWADRYLEKLNVQPGGTIEGSVIESSFQLGSIIADEINTTIIDAINEIDKITIRKGAFNLRVDAGRLGTLKVKEDILGSSIQVAGPVKLIQAKGDIISTIEVTGPYGDLIKLKAGGDIGTPVGGEIIVDGQVGTIQAGGDFLADLILNWIPDPVGPGNPQGPHQKFNFDGVELNSLKAGGKIVGLMDIGGDINKIQSGDEFGVFGSQLRVHGDLKKLVVGSGKNASDLESSVQVEENLGTVTVYGDSNGQFDVVENFKSLTLKGSGDNRADLNASITVGGDFGKLAIINGDIALTDVVDGGAVMIDVAGEGPQISIKGSDIEGTVIVHGGDGINIDGSITSTGRYISTDDVGTLLIRGDIASGGVLDIRGDLDTLIVEGAIRGTVRVSGNVGEIQATNILGTNSIVTAGGDINVIDVSGLMRDTYVLSGFDAGDIVDEDGNILQTRTEQLLNGTATQGDIDTAKVGTLDNSVIAAGVSPGTNVIFGDLDGSDTPGMGLSTIGSVVIGTTEGTGSPFGVFADSEIDTMRVAGAKTPTPASQSDGFRAWTISEIEPGSIGGFVFEQGLPFRGVIDGVTVTVSMNGPGTGEVLPGNTQIDTILLRETSGKTKVKVTAAGGATIDVGEIFNGDDEDLNQLVLDGYIVNADSNASLTIGGGINKLQLKGIGAGSTVTVGGAAGKADLGELIGTTTHASTVLFYEDVNQMRLDSVSSEVSVTADNLDKLSVKTDMNGVLNVVDRYLGTATIGGNLGGVINSAGDIYKIVVKGMTGGEGLRDIQGIRAAEDIGLFIGQDVKLAVVAAGENFEQAKIKGDVTFSTLAAGLDIGPGGTLFDYGATSELDADRDTPGRGNVEKVQIKGDFIESNIVAALAPGEDNMFGTGDDQLEQRSIEEIDAPQIVNVFFDTTDLTEISIQFGQVEKDRSGNIEDVVIQGDVFGSISPAEQFLIGAAGVVDSVFVHRQAFEGEDNVLRQEISNKEIDGSTLEEADVTPANAATVAIQIRSDGLDHIFGTADDVIISSDADPLTSPTVWVEYDPVTNTAIYHNEDGFTINPWSTNYYQILVDGDQVLNKQGVPLDGDFSGRWPTGNGVPGGDFEYYFAMADLGDTLATAFSPFAHTFPENLLWSYQSGTGDNPQLSGEDVLDEMDFVRMNNLEEGQILNVELREDTGVGWEWWSFSENSSEYVVQLWQVVDENVESALVPAYGFLGLDDIAHDSTQDPTLVVPADLVVPELDEIAFAGDTLYGFDGIGHQFYAIDPTLFSNSVLLDNSLNDLNSLLTTQGATILDLKALTGHGEDSIWAIAEVLPMFGSPVENLILINKLSQDVTNSNPALRANLTLASYDLSGDYSDIVGLEEYNGVLYGVDAASNTLFTIDADTFSVTFGQPSPVGAGTGNLGVDDFRVAGLSQNQEGTGLIFLHDQPANFFDNFLVDSLYEVDTATGTASLLQEFTTDAERHGLATNPGEAIWVAQPLRNSPLGDTITVQFGNQGPMDHVFGTDTSDFSGGNVVTSAASSVPLNLMAQEFIDAGYYYGFDIQYAHGSGYGDVTIEITDIDWLNETENGTIIAMTSDDPADVVILPLLELDGGIGLEIQIDAEDGDGSVRVYFAATSEIESLEPPELIKAGVVAGTGTRSDLSPQRDTLVPQLNEFTINSGILFQEFRLDLDDVLEASLESVLSADLMGRIRDELTINEIIEVDTVLTALNELALLADFNAAITVINYDAAGYDTGMDTFMLVSTTSYDARPITVDPNGIFPTPETDDDVVLTSAVLSDLYSQINLSFDFTFSDIRGLEFGEMTFLIDPLYLVATVTEANPGTGATFRTRDSILRIDNILDPTTPADPMTGMKLSVHDLDFLGFEDIRTIAYGNIPGNHANNGLMYGIDSASQTLVRIDPRLLAITPTNVLEVNSDYGRAKAVGKELGNLGQGSYDIKAIDFGRDGKLYGIETNTQSVVEIFTGSTAVEGSDRLELVMGLPSADYTQIDFDNSSLTSTGLLSRPVTGSPWNDTVEIQINGGAKAGHTIGNLSTTIGDVFINSSVGNDASTVNAEGGYYRFTVTYDTNQGDLLLAIDDINWLGGNGNIDDVFVSDTLNVSVQNFGADNLSILIHSDHTVLGGGTDDSVVIYYGATSDLALPTTGQRNLELVTTYTGLGSVIAPFEIPEDGDYVVQVTSDLIGTLFDPGFAWIGVPSGSAFGFILPGAATPLSNYELRMEVFDDGNSDFGLSETPNYLYDQVFPNNSPVNLEPLSWGNTELVPDEDDPDLYTYDPTTSSAERLTWPVTVEGSLLEPGIAGSVTIDADLGNIFDVDVFSLRLEEGQRITVDLDAEVLFGNDSVSLAVGIYNGDFEALATIVGDADDVLATTAAQQSDPLYEAQAIFTIPNHASVILDPEVNGLGTYYVVVTGYAAKALTGVNFFDVYSNEPIPYQLTIETTAPELVDVPPSQLVWLAFDGAQADYLFDVYGGLGGTPDVVNRPAFDSEVFDLEDMRVSLIEAIADRIELMYRNAGLAENEIAFTTEKPPAGATYSTVIFGGKTANSGLLGIAEKVDRHNDDRSDMAIVLTDEIAQGILILMDEDPTVRFEETVNVIAWTGAHELGHILGLEHVTEINTNDPSNIMGYNFENVLEPQWFKERNSSRLFAEQQGRGLLVRQIGFENEIDQMLRYIGSGTPMGI